jgi:hypothetical protein
MSKYVIVGLLVIILAVWIAFNVYKAYKSGVDSVRGGAINREDNPTSFYTTTVMQSVLSVALFFFGLYLLIHG